MNNTDRLAFTFKGKRFYIYFIVLIFCLMQNATAVSIDDLETTPLIQLDDSGYYPDIALNPIDKNPHLVWVNDNRMVYTYRKADGSWMPLDYIDLGGRIPYGEDEHGGPSRNVAITVGTDGVVHMIFCEDDGDVNYFKGNYGDWGPITDIAESSTSKSIPDIVESQGNLYVVYEEGAEDQIYMVAYINGEWKNKFRIDRGEYPVLARNDNGMVYFASRNRLDVRNALFGYVQSGSTNLNLVNGATNAEYRMGSSLNLAVHDGMIYLPWCDVPGPNGPTKSHMFCAGAPEPGLNWTHKLGGPTPLFYENTATPNPRVEVFEDGTVLYVNGRRLDRRFMVWDGNEWSDTRPSPWTGGAVHVVSAGHTIWGVCAGAGDISVASIRMPGADPANTLAVSETTLLSENGHSGDVAINPVDGSIYNLWVNDGGLKFRERRVNGSWNNAQNINTDNLYVHGRDVNDFPQMCSNLDVDQNGNVHILFSEENGGVYYLSGTPGNWGSPVKIADHDGYVIYPAIVSIDNTIYAAWHDVANNTVNMAEYSNNAWSSPVSIGSGSHPELRRGDNGMVYFLYQEETGTRLARFAWQVPGYTDWSYTNSVANPADELGDNPTMAVGGGKIYVAWNNNTEVSGDQKGQLYCAVADEPGMEWTPRFNTPTPIFYENTGDPHVAPSVYSDGSVLYMNGRRQSKRFAMWNGEFWSGSKLGPWNGGTPRIVNDGATAWIMVSQISGSSANVTLTGVENPDAVATDYTNTPPEITSVPDTVAPTETEWTYSAAAQDNGVDPLVWSLILAPDGMTINPTQGLLSWTPQADHMTADPWNAGAGRHLVGIKTIDAGGRWDTQYFWLHVGEINAKPQITSEPVTQAWVDSVYTYQVVANDPDSDTLIYSIQQGPENMTISADSGLVQWTPQDSDQGEYDIIVKVADTQGGKTTQEYTLNVTKVTVPPTPWFTADTTYGLAPLAVQFTDASTGDIDQWQWDFGDGNTSAEQNPGHTYTEAGSFTVKLVVTGPDGMATLAREGYINVYNETLVPQFSTSPQAGFAPLTVQFTDESSGNIEQWQWNFGDGNTSAEQNPEHTFSEPGSYTVTMRVTGPSGNATIIKEDIVQVYPDLPQANFSAEPMQGPAPLTVAFSDLSTGVIDSWLWIFGDGEFSNEQNPEHIYESEGNYNVSLIVSNAGGSDTLSLDNYIRVQITQAVEDDKTQAPTSFNMFQNYPNPFNAQTTLSYELPSPAQVELIIYDINGQLVKILFRGVQSSGAYRWIWDGTDYYGRSCASGMYIAHLQAGDKLSDKKIMLVK